MFKKEKNYDYFDYFTCSASFACEAANYLQDSLNAFNASTFHTRMESMHEIENRADDEKHHMMSRLFHEFLPPIDREDIVELSNNLDDVVDAIDEAILRVDMYCLTAMRPEVLEFTKLIVRCCSELQEVVAEFKNFKKSAKLREAIVTVNSTESEGDKLYAKCIRSLYTDPSIDAKAVLAWSSVYEDLEMCLDACEKAVNVIEGVIMKNT